MHLSLARCWPMNVRNPPIPAALLRQPSLKTGPTTTDPVADTFLASLEQTGAAFLLPPEALHHLTLDRSLVRVNHQEQA